MTGAKRYDGGLGLRRGFGRTLAFGLLAALGVPAVRLLQVPLMGHPAIWHFYVAGLAVVYLIAIAGSPRRVLGSALLGSIGAVALLLLTPGIGVTVVGASLLVACVRSGFLYRVPQPRLLLLEAGLLGVSLAAVELLVGPGVFGIALAVWAYFLVQSLWFLVARPRPRTLEPPGDPFERARDRLDGLLEEMDAGRP